MSQNTLKKNLWRINTFFSDFCFLLYLSLVQVFKNSLAKNLSQPSKSFVQENTTKVKTNVATAASVTCRTDWKLQNSSKKSRINAGPRAVPQQRRREFRCKIYTLPFCKVWQSKLPRFSNATKRAIQAVLSCGSETKLPATHGPRWTLYLWRRWPRRTESLLLYQSGNLSHM